MDLRGGISIDADCGPLGYVFWCCGSRSQDFFTFIHVDSGHTVSALSNHKIVLFFTHHDFLFHFFLSYFCHLEAIYLGIEEVRLKFNQKKNPFKFIKPQHGSFFTLTKIKLDHVIFQLQFKNNWLMWLWFLLWFFLNISPIKWFRFFFVKVKGFYGFSRLQFQGHLQWGQIFFKVTLIILKDFIKKKNWIKYMNLKH